MDLLTAGTAFAVLEFAYLSQTVQSVYVPMFAQVQGGEEPTFRNALAGGLLAYASLCAAWFVLVYTPCVRDQACDLPALLLRSTCLALAAYGVYNGTNLATFDTWQPWTAALDVAWGVFVLGVVSVIARRVRGVRGA